MLHDCYNYLLHCCRHRRCHHRQAKFGAQEQKTEDVFVILVSDKLLLCLQRDDGRLIVRDRKDLNPIVFLHSITDVRGEIACM